ncbi:MAG TPA: hypothetical protein VEQ16_06955 [Acidocella sp.]|nr:hypothetical protein [Acidocella sp.]
MKNFRLLILAALLPLIGCSGGPNPPPAGQAQAQVHAKRGPAVFYCPNPAVLQQAQTATYFQPGRLDVGGRVSTAQVSIVSGTCQFEKSKNAVLMTINASFLADNGPANNFAPLALPWFVAITAEDNSIIQKINYTQILKFDGNSSTTTATAKPVKVELPNTPDTQNLQILVGFQESPDQLAYAAAHPEAAP